VKIPVGTTHLATIKASKWNHTKCDHCGREYMYLIVREEEGKSTDILWLSPSRAKAYAEADARAKVEAAINSATEVYHCPNCGYFPEDYAKKRFKREKADRIIIVTVLSPMFLLILGFFVFLNVKSSLFQWAIISLAILITYSAMYLIFRKMPVKNINERAEFRRNRQPDDTYPVLTKDEFIRLSQ
jgi:hypothetical protein